MMKSVKNNTLLKLVQVFVIAVTDVSQLLLNLALAYVQAVAEIFQILIIVSKLRIDVT